MEQKKQSALNGLKAAFLTLGCKVNAYETEAMQKLLCEAGAELVEFEEKADIYIINTCSVTNIADRKSRQMLHKARRLNENAVVVAAGCYVQTAGEALAKETGIDLVIGNNKKGEIVSLLEDYFKEHRQLCVLPDIAKEASYEELSLGTVTEKTRAYIKVEDGCNQFCSYCIIPYARGRVRSRKEEDVIEEVTRLAKNGYQEIVVTGIHLSSYGMTEFDKGMGEGKAAPLLALLNRLQQVEGISRIRLGSLEPRVMTEEFVAALAKLSKLCPHFHLSLQSGCDATLKRMNRKYTAKEYEDAVGRLRSHFENPALTTDVIVGFPGETDEEFACTEQFLKRVAFSKLHVFKYSRRKGTVADRMKDQVPDAVKAARSDCLLALGEAQEKAYAGSFLHTVEEVLFEEEIALDGSFYQIGHTKRYVRVAVPLSKEEQDLTNTLRQVLLTGLLQKELVLGELI